MRTPFAKIKKNLTGKRKLKNSNDFLYRNRNPVKGYSTFMSFAEAYDYEVDKSVNGFEYHFITLRNAIRIELINHNLFIGPDVLEDLLYSAIVNDLNPIESCINGIRDFKLHQPGFVVYPLHSFGILNYGLYRVFANGLVYYSNPKRGIAISAQSNSKDYLYNFLKNALNDLNLKNSVNEQSVEHYLRSRPLDWLLHNPILVQKFRAFTGRYYSNQRFMTIKLELATSFLYSSQSLLTNSTLSKSGSNFSSKKINNFQTYDIKHYLLFTTPVGQRRYFETDCIPINFDKAYLNEISELNLDLFPQAFKKHHDFSDLIETFNEFEKQYLKYFNSKKNRPIVKRYQRLYLSLKFFRRSFLESPENQDEIINLCIAFETLLIDSNERFKKLEPVLDKLSLTLKHRKGKQQILAAVKELFKARNEIVHSGKHSLTPNIGYCRKGFILSFIKLNGKVNYGSIKNESLINDIISQVCN